MTVKKAKRRRPKTSVTVGTNLKWTAIREDYIAQNLIRRANNQSGYTLAKCAKAHGVDYDYLRQISASQKWKDELAAAERTRADEVVSKLDGVSVWDEIEIRTRQATYARLASALAYDRLKAMTPDQIAKMSVKYAIELLKLGLVEERAALGIKDVIDSPPQDDARMLSDSQVFAVARRMLQMREPNGGSETNPGS